VFLKVDVDKLRGTAAKYQVKAMPTFMFFKSGTKIHEFKGADPNQLQQSIQMYAGAAVPQTTAPAKPQFKYFPKETYEIWDTGKVDMILDKLLTFNTKLAADTVTASCSLDASEVSSLKRMAATLKETNKYHYTKFTAQEHQALVKSVTRFPVGERFPPLDILRLLILHPEGSLYHANTGIVDQVLKLLYTEEPFANHLMELRFLGNCFRWLHLRTVVAASYQKVLDALTTYLKSDNKSLRNAAVTILLNYAIYFNEASASLEDKRKCLNTLVQGLSNETEEDALLRTVVALGTLTSGDKQLKEELKERRQIIESIKSDSAKVREVMAEISSLMDNRAPQPQAVPTGIQQPPGNPPAMGNQGSGFPPMAPTGNPMVDPNLFAQMAQSPDIIAAAQNPALMAKLQQLMANPTSIAQYQNDPELMSLVTKLMGIMQQK